MRRYSRKKNSVRIFSAITLFAAVLFVASYYIANKKEEGVVVAKVNGTEIYQSEIEQKLRSIFEGQGEEVSAPTIENLPKEVLDILIKETYLDKELSKLAKESSVGKDKKVEEQIAAVESKILRQAYIDATVAKEVTDQKVSDKYAEIASSIAGKKEYLVFHIVTKTKAEAEKLRNEITAKKKSIKFADAAKKYSLDQESAARGGELGFVMEDNMIKEIADAIANLKQDEISAPIQTKFGWHLVKFTESREAQLLPFDAVKENIREQLEQDKANEIEAKIVKGAKVEILLKSKDKSSEPKTETSAQPAAPVDQPAVIDSTTVEPEAVVEQQVEPSSEPQVEVQPEQQESEKKQDEKSKTKETKHDKKHRNQQS